MIRRLRSFIRPVRRTKHQPVGRCTVVIASQCLEDVTEGMSPFAELGHEAIVYFVGLTTGTTTLALAAIFPEAVTTPGNVDVSAPEVGKIVRVATASGLQVVGQLHTHPRTAFHSAGDLSGMRIRYPGYVSIVVPEYGARLPLLQESHALMWTGDTFHEVDEPIRVFGR